MVQIAASPLLAELREIQHKLGETGFDAFVSSQQTGESVRHRLRVRPAQGQGIDELAAELSARGFATWVTSE